MGDGDEEQRSTTLWGLRKIIPYLEPQDRLPFVLQMEGRLEDESQRAREAALLTLGEIISDLRPQDRLPRILKIEERLEDANERTRWTALKSLSGIVQLKPEDQPPRFLKIAERLEDNYLAAQQAAGELLLALIPLSILGSDVHFTLALKTAELLDADTIAKEGNLGSTAARAIQHMLPQLESKDLLTLAFKVGGYLESDYVRAHFPGMYFMPGHMSLWLFERLILPLLGTGDRLKAIQEKVTQEGLHGLRLEALKYLFRRIPPNLFSLFAAKQKDPELSRLAEYYAAHLPWDRYFWKGYLEAPDPSRYLEAISSGVKPYQRGQLLLKGGEQELRLAYAGLGSPERLSFEKFVKDIDQAPPPPPFLQDSFEARVPLVRALHQEMDKGKVFQALDPLSSVLDADAFRAYFSHLFQREKRALRKLKEDLLAVFPQGFAGLTTEEIIAGARELLPRIYPKANNPPIQELVVRLSLLLAWHREEMEALRPKMEGIRGTRIPSETVWEALKATEEFYRDRLEDALREFGISGDTLPFIKKQRWLLSAELARIKKTTIGEVRVEFVPSKSQADRFFGYVGEDCTGWQANSIYRDDFQVYRMIEEERTVGILYLQRAELDGKRVLVMAIQPKPSWEVGQAALLKAIEENFGRIGSEQDYDYVLLSSRPILQSNRPDMLQAIQERKYPEISFKQEISGAVFSGNNFLVVWRHGFIHK